MIPYGDIRKTAPATDTPRDHEARQRAAATATTFGNRNQCGPRIDFSAKSGPAAPSSGMNGSILDLYGSTAFKADIARRDERSARPDALPQAVQRLSTEQGVTDLDLLQTVAIIHRNCKTMNGPAQVFPDQIGKAIGVTTQRAEELTRDAAQRGFIEARPNCYWRCKL